MWSPAYTFSPSERSLYRGSTEKYAAVPRVDARRTSSCDVAVSSISVFTCVRTTDWP